VLERLCAELGCEHSVTFLGRVDNRRMPELTGAPISCSTLLVDNMPISLLEAMGSAVLIVSTDVGGVPYMVEHENTALHGAASGSGAMAAVLRLVDDPVLSGRLRAGALEAVEGYAWPRLRGRWLDVYARAMDRRRRDLPRMSPDEEVLELRLVNPGWSSCGASRAAAMPPSKTAISTPANWRAHSRPVPPTRPAASS